MRAAGGSEVEVYQPHLRQVRSGRAGVGKIAPVHRDVRDRGHAGVRGDAYRGGLEPRPALTSALRMRWGVLDLSPVTASDIIHPMVEYEGILCRQTA